MSRLSVDRFLDEAGEPQRDISAPQDLETGRIWMMSAVNVHPSGRVGMVIGMSRSVHAAMKLNSATVLKPGPALGTAIRRLTPIGAASASILRAIITAATTIRRGREVGKGVIVQRTKTKAFVARF